MFFVLLFLAFLAAFIAAVRFDASVGFIVFLFFLAVIFIGVAICEKRT